MSAGICIMNRQAIALAADSAVTVGDHAAIHNSANKLFSLSRLAPVGLIIYANAALMNVPVEIIVKQYKKQLADKTFSKLSEYVDDYILYIEANASLFRFGINEKDYVVKFFADYATGLLGDFRAIKNDAETKKGVPLTKDEIDAIAEKAVDLTVSFVDNKVKRCDYAFKDYILNNYKVLFVDLVKADPNFNWMCESQIDVVCNKACELFDTDFDRNGYVGIAIAGYGEQEIYPQMIHIHLSGWINGRLRYYIRETAEISENTTASVTPLAQTDVMQTFLFGINDRFISDLEREIPRQINETIDHIDVSNFTNGNKDLVRGQLANVTNNILQHMAQIARENYMLPIIQSVSTLPIEELALLAESMINITSLRRKVALDRDIGTVGGPIDVAIISKGDGFIWLKRKHYFDPKYNPQYLYSHFDKVERGDLNDD